MAKLFLDGIFTGNSQSPSSVTVKLSGGGDYNFSLVGLTTSDPSFSAQNKWGPVINDVSNLQDLFSLVGQDMASWVHASTMCWKGTSPLIMGAEFYLINYKRGLGLKDKLKKLVKLAAIGKGEGNSGIFVKIHGGYKPNVTSDNNSAYWTAQVSSITGLKNFGAGQSITNGELCTITLTFGNKFSVSNLLLSKIDVTESNVEVSDINGNSIEPLYYRVSAQFTGVKPLLTTDVDSIFGSVNKG